MLKAVLMQRAAAVSQVDVPTRGREYQLVFVLAIGFQFVSTSFAFDSVSVSTVRSLRFRFDLVFASFIVPSSFRVRFASTPTSHSFRLVVVSM